MIAKERIYGLIRDLLNEDNDVFVVSLDVSSGNKITLLIDSMKGIKVDDCVKFSRAIEFGLNREEEDFELEVSSPGVGLPFRIQKQYLKNIGRDVEVLLKSGALLRGKLSDAGESEFSIDAEIKVKTENKKKKKLIIEQKTVAYDEVNKVSVVLKFK